MSPVSRGRKPKKGKKRPARAPGSERVNAKELGLSGLRLGDVRVMRDAYGTRFGVVAGFCYPGGVDPSAYLLDIDACGSIDLAGAAVFDDVAQAAAAWRDRVGVSADGLVPVPATGVSAASD